MRIQHNIMAMNAYRNYTNNVAAMKKNLEKLSSGYRINRAGDDAAGLAISEKMRAQITGLETAQKNAKDGISLVQTAEGALTEVHDMLNRMVELATQSANGTYDNDTDRFQLQKEMDQLRTEINRIADSANFNGIKLFDGSLSGADITATGIDVSQIDMAKGVEVVQGTNGGGSNGVYTINLDSALSDGDTLTLTFGGQAAADLTGNLVLTYADSAGAVAPGKTAGVIAHGTTLEEQATNIMKALKANADVSKHFDITTDGSSVVLTSKIEGNKTAANSDTEPITSTVTNAVIADSKATSDFDNTTTAAADSTAGIAKFDKMFEDGAGGGINISAGDRITFDVKIGNTTATLTAVAGVDFDIKDTNKATGDELIKFLNSDKAVFTDDDSTFIDESKIKFSDLFTAAGLPTATTAYGLQLTQKSGLVDISATATAAEIKITNTKPDGATKSAAAAAGTASGTAAKAQEYTLDLDAGGSPNLSNGDKLTIEGKLTDGRTFKFDVEAGKDFQVGKTYNETINNLKALLESDSFSVALKDKDGNEVKPAKGSDIFGDNAEIKIDATAGGEKFVSNAKGTMASQITGLTLTNGDAAAISSSLKNGDQKTSADSTITLSEGVSYGAVVEVNGQKYELVKAAGDVSNANNKAVIVDDISDLASAAKALAEAIKGDVNTADYKVTASNNKVTIASTKVGSTAQAVSASASGDKTTQIEFTLDPKKMQAGSTVTINGQTYEFVGKGGKPTDKANQTIEVADFSKETASSLGSALAKLANGQNSASVTVDGDGKVTVRGLVDGETNKIVTPTVKFDGGTSGLTLQIGDTAEDFNKMTVSIYNMHTADMGIGDIRIDNQEDAAAAIDKIKSAINYVSDVRGTLGATQNRLDHTINNLSVMTENIQDAESTIRDTDVAAEMMAYTKNNILIQSAQAMLAQANQVPQGVLQLLQ